MTHVQKNNQLNNEVISPTVHGDRQGKGQYCELKSRNSSASLGKGCGEAIEKVRMCESRNDETDLHVVTV